MSLDDLCPFANEQQKAITAASSGFTPRNDPSWTTFRNSLWQENAQPSQEMKSVERDRVDPVADVQLPPLHLVAEVPSILCNLFNIESDKLLVRSEYEEAERAAVLSCMTGTRVFVVGGTPGIGLLSSFFNICRT